MKTFIDNAGRTWTVSVTVAAVKRVKDLLGVNLMDAIEGKLLERLANDPVLLCDVVYVICKSEADAAKVSDEDFGRAMAGDALDRATVAFMEDLVSFFPAGRRRLLAKAMEKLKALEQRVLEAAEARLDSGEAERLIEAELARPSRESVITG